MPRKSGVYMIYCHANGKAYVGSSANVAGRLTSHRYHLRHNKHGNQHLQNAWNLYGETSFSMSIIQDCHASELLKTEQIWLDIWCQSGSSFNRRTKAESPLGVRWTDAERAAKSAAMKANPPFKGRHHSDHSKALLSAHAKKRTGAFNHFSGKSHTAETREIISKANMGNKYCLGRVLSQESRAKMSAAQGERTHSDETKSKISAATSGANNPRFGKKMSEESKRKAIATRAANRAAGLHKSKPLA